jgi:hypothetical protein
MADAEWSATIVDKKWYTVLALFQRKLKLETMLK